MHKRFSLIPFAVLVAGGCETGGDAALVARAEEYRLSVNEAVDLLTGVPDLPNETNVVKAIGELWVDYVLLGEAARRDTTMAVVDPGPLVEQQVERRLILALRDSVIEADTSVSEDELRTLWEDERPGVTVEARHIFLTLTEDASDARRDSVRLLAGRIREQVVSDTGSFEDLAREYSEDEGTAQRGGRLGLVGKGQSIPGIEEVLFALEPGEISQVVETPYGLHVFRVDERTEPGFEEVRQEFLGQVRQRRHEEAESTYIAGLLDEASLRPVDEAADLTRRMAEDPAAPLSRRAGRRTVVDYRGGSVTLTEVRDFMQASQPDYRGRVVQASDDVVEDEVLLGIAQRELLVQRARDMGFEVGSEARDSLSGFARQRFVEAARQVGVLHVSPSADESPREAVKARVESILEEMLTGTRDVLPLGAVSWALRKQFASRIFQTGVERAVQQVGDARGSPGPGAPPGGPGTGGPGDPAAAPPDTAGGV